MDKKELDNRFMHHPPKNQTVVDMHEGVRDYCLNLAEFLEGLLPDGREKSLAMTKIEEAMFWANAAIARNPE